MIAPATYDITIPQRATFSQTFTLKDGDGVALNLAGHTVTAQLWTAGRGTKLADFTVAWVNQGAGQFRLTLAATVTRTLTADGYWDLLVANPDGSKDYWLRGAARLDPGYTE